jgi:DNA polymerase-3 subunit gamma/tau
MSYLVFARKWRPQNFDEIVGQSHVAKTLKNAISSKRIAHAYIFSGPRGVGKTSTARIFAKALNCQKGISANPCNECANCRDISQGISLDVLEIDGASNRGIDEIRQLRENVKFSPSSANFKIYIIDEVHMLTTEAFNALLKTLEEPPEHVKFIFATTQPNKVLPTILSRCQRFDFRKISIVEITQKLKEIIKAEHINIDEKVLVAIAKSADGSLRDAESILDQLVSYSADKISLKDVTAVLGLIEQDVLFEFGKMIIESNTQSLIKLLDSLLSSGKDLSQLLDNLIEHFRNLMVCRISNSQKITDLVDLPQDFAQAIFKQSQELSLERILYVLQALVDVKELGRRINSLRIPLEVAFVKITHNFNQPTVKPKEEIQVKNQHPAEPVVRTIPAVIKSERGAINISGDKEEKNIPPASVDKAIDVNIDLVNSIWNSFLNQISQTRMSVATYLADAKLDTCENYMVTVSLPRGASFHKEFLEHKENQQLIEQTFNQLLGARVRVNFVISDREPEKQEEHESFVKDIMEKFKGRVI